MINVTYKVITTALQAKNYLSKLPLDKPIALDFETAIRYSSEELHFWKSQIESGTLSKLEATALQNKVNATALDHASHIRFTHCSLATSNNEAVVFIMDNTSLVKYVLNFLVSTEIKQVWHNSSYDFRILYYYTSMFPKVYEDSALLAKCLTNHVDIQKSGVRLKDLAGYMYGSWGISSDNFVVEQMYEPHVLQYAATDACATYWLWEYMNNECDALDMTIKEKYKP